MKKTPFLRGLMALLLFIMLLGSLAPAVYAAEEGSIPDEVTQSFVDPPDETCSQADSDGAGDKLPEDTPDPTAPDAEDGIVQSEDEPQSAVNPPDETSSQADGDGAGDKLPEDTPDPTDPNAGDGLDYEGDVNIADQISLFSDAGISLFSTTPSYAVWGQMSEVQSSGGETISFTYNGKTYTHDNLVLIGLDLNQDGKLVYSEAAYCIEPGASLDSSYTYLPTEHTGVSDAWGLLDKNQRQAIALALLYGFPNRLIADSSGSTATQNKYNAHYQLATAIIVHEICIGYRSASVTKSIRGNLAAIQNF